MRNQYGIRVGRAVSLMAPPPEAYAAAPPSEVEFGVETTADAEAAEKAGAVCPQCGSPLFTFQFVLHRI
ncbi:MAG: hypothetical protein QXS68_05535 [Candidatus Methanomethylicaceae archaeon]